MIQAGFSATEQIRAKPLVKSIFNQLKKEKYESRKALLKADF